MQQDLLAWQAITFYVDKQLHILRWQVWSYFPFGYVAYDSYN